MSLVFDTIFAWKTSSTHHKLALHALPLMRRHDADEWQELFLVEIDRYLKGSKAPDDEFKDFKNHVLHVSENFWGGALTAARQWFGKTVDALKQREWPTAVYNAGVLSHYFTDPFQPFHTGQSDREAIVHRAAEWSITKSYDELRKILLSEGGGYPTPAMPSGDDWLEQLIKQGATQGHRHYEFLVDHYDFAAGTKNPLLGMDRESKEIIAKQLGAASAGFALVLERAIVEAGILVPSVNVSLPALAAAAGAPMSMITKRIADAKTRAQVEAMFLEYQRTGKVIDTLPEDDRTVRALHCEEVLKIPLAQLNSQPVEPVGTKHGEAANSPKPAPQVKPAPAKPAPAKPAVTLSTPVVSSPSAVVLSPQKPLLKATTRTDDLTLPAAQKVVSDPPAPVAPVASTTSEPEPVAVAGSTSRLSLTSPVVDAPSIGNKTAERFGAIGIRTIQDLLDGDVNDMAKRLKVGHINPTVLTSWQNQTRLMLDVPGLKALDVQLLVGVEICTADELALANARDLHELVTEFCDTSEGKRALREANPPDLARVGNWIALAKKRSLGKAA